MHGSIGGALTGPRASAIPTPTVADIGNAPDVDSAISAAAAAVNAGPSVTSFTDQLKTLTEQVKSGGIVQKVRENENPLFGVNADEFLNAITVANNPMVRMDLRKQAMDQVNSVLQAITGPTAMSGPGQTYNRNQSVQPQIPLVGGQAEVQPALPTPETNQAQDLKKSQGDVQSFVPSSNDKPKPTQAQTPPVETPAPARSDAAPATVPDSGRAGGVEAAGVGNPASDAVTALARAYGDDDMALKEFDRITDKANAAAPNGIASVADVTEMVNKRAKEVAKLRATDGTLENAKFKKRQEKRLDTVLQSNQKMGMQEADAEAGRLDALAQEGHVTPEEQAKNSKAISAVNKGDLGEVSDVLRVAADTAQARKDGLKRVANVAAANDTPGIEVSRFNGKYGKGMSRDAAKLESMRLNRTGDGKTLYSFEEHNDPNLENPYAVVGRRAAEPVAAKPARKAKQAEPAAPVPEPIAGLITDEENASLDARSKVIDAKLDAMTDEQVRDVYARAGLKGNGHSVGAQLKKLKQEHPDDIEPLLSAPKVSEQARGQRDIGDAPMFSRSTDNGTNGIEPLRLAPYTHAEMIARGADGQLSRGYERYVPIDKLDGLEPVPSNNESDDGKYHPGKPITQPIEVQANIADGTFMVYSGNHRIAQAKANGQTHILAFVEPDPSDSRGIARGSVSRTNPDAPNENGAPMFSRAEPTAAEQQSVASIQSLVDAIKSKWANAPDVVVAYDLSDPAIPERVRQEDQKQRSGGAAGTPEGFFYKGTVYLMSSQLKTNQDVTRVLLHEALGHAGLRGVFGKSLNGVLRQIVQFRKAEVAAKIKEYGLTDSDADKLTAAEEILAERAQANPKLGFVRQAVAAIRTWLRENIPSFNNLRMNDAEIVRNFIIPARDWVVRGQQAETGGLPAFARVWHGSPHKFDKFDASKIGTGEGAQAYGHGLYLAENPKVASSYGDGSLGFSIKGKKIDTTVGNTEDVTGALNSKLLSQGLGEKEALIMSHALTDVNGMEPLQKLKEISLKNSHNEYGDIAKKLQNEIDFGSLYKIDLPDEHIARMLDWDKPLSQQHPDVQKSLAELALKNQAFIGGNPIRNFILENTKQSGSLPSVVIAEIEKAGSLNAALPAINQKFANANESAKGRLNDLLDALRNQEIQIKSGVDTVRTGRSIVRDAANPEEIANVLKARGIPGIRYLDGGSRSTGAGTSNYVVFPGNEHLLTILERNGKPVTSEAEKAEIAEAMGKTTDSPMFSRGTNDPMTNKDVVGNQGGRSADATTPGAAKHSPEQMAKWAAEKKARDEARMISSSAQRDAEKRLASNADSRIRSSEMWSHFTDSEKSDIDFYRNAADKAEEGKNATINAIERALKTAGITVEHTSSSNNGKSKSLYVKLGDQTIRVSDHELPMTPSRENDRARGLTGKWDHEVIVSDWQNMTLNDYLREIGLPDTNGAPMFSRSKIVGETTRKHTPEQIKAMENVGFITDEKTLKERAQALWKDAGKKLAQGIADQFAPVKDLDKEAYGLLRLAKGAAGAFEALLHGGKLKLDAGVYNFDDTQRGGVVDRLIKPMQGEHHDALRWVAANRAEQLLNEWTVTFPNGTTRVVVGQAAANQIAAANPGAKAKATPRENLFTQQDINAFKTLATGTTDFDYMLQTGAKKGQVTRDRSLIYPDFNRILKEFNNNVLDMVEQSGGISPQARADFEREFYLPFYRDSGDDNGIFGPLNSGGAVRQNFVKTLKGGKDKLNADLLDNTLQNWAHMLDAAAKNRAAKATIEAAERLGVAAGGNQSTLQQMASSINNKKGIVWFMDGGVKRYSMISDQDDGPYILTALSSLEYAGMNNPVMNAMSAFKHALTIGVTASPYFKIRNLIRDSVQVIGTSKIDANPYTNIKEGWKLTDPKSDAYFRLLAGGGTIHFGSMEKSQAKKIQELVSSGVDPTTILSDPNKVKAFINRYLKPGWNAYNKLGNRGEAINRASLYDQLVRDGMNHAEASLQARSLMDFSMQGSFTTIRFLSQVVPFFSARISGMTTLARAFKDNPARFSTVIAAASVASIGLLLAYGDDDDWKKRTESDRNNFWWFKFGDTAFRIPRPFEIGAVGTLAERTWELAFEKEMTNKRFVNQVLSVLGDNLSMNPIPQMVKPIIDVYANKNSFTGQPIESMGMEHLKSEYRFNSNTSMAARAASTALNTVTGIIGKEALSPVQLDSMLHGYFSWLGAMVVGAGDILARPMTSQPERPASDIWKAATGGMVSDLRDAPSRYVNAVYEQGKALEEAYGTWRSLSKEGKFAEAQEFYKNHEKEIGKYKTVENVKRAEARLNERRRIIERSAMAPEEKRTAIRNIREQQDRLARSLEPA